jgi:hypothetical protein
MEPENSADERLRFAVSVSRDRDQFFRLTCPSCGRDFKVLIDPNDLQWAISSYCQRVGCDIGPKNPDQTSPSRLRCPYCGVEDECVHMHTEETVVYLKRIINRELVLPLVNRWASGLEHAIGGRAHPGGLLSISVKFKHSPSALSVRPIHGPEPADYKIVTFLCCAKKIKISDNWTDVRVCSFCGAEVALI